jgi:hypothetical protein
MKDHSLPKGVARNWRIVLRRLKWFLEYKGNRAEYCRKYLVDTTVSTFVRKAAEGSPYWAYRARQDLIKALQEYKEEEEDDEDDEDESSIEDEIPDEFRENDSV